MSEWHRLEVGDPIRVRARFENGAERVDGGDFGGLLTNDDGQVLLQVWMLGGSSDVFALRDIVELHRLPKDEPPPDTASYVLMVDADDALSTGRVYARFDAASPEEAEVEGARLAKELGLSADPPGYLIRPTAALLFPAWLDQLDDPERSD